MRRAAYCLAALFLLPITGCKQQPSASEQTPVPAEVAPPTPPPTQYVWASVLNLRAEAATDSRVLGKVAINSPVEVLDVRNSSRAHVRVGNGKTGWVSAHFLNAARLDLAEATRRARTGDDADDALSWWQRAAAIAPADRAVLKGLAAAYRAAGDEAAAKQVGAQLAFPETILPVDVYREDHLVIQWKLHATPMRDGLGGELTNAEAAELGLSKRDVWWVLPDVGPAIQTGALRFRSEMINECGGTYAVLVDLAYDKPSGRRAIAVSKGTAPASWSEASALPKMSEGLARQAVSKALGKLKAGKDAGVIVGPVVDHWRAKVTWEYPSAPEDEVYTLEWIDVTVAADKSVHEVRRGKYDCMGCSSAEWIAGRDIDGDGRTDIVEWEHCGATITSADGALLARTESRCCGC